MYRQFEERGIAFVPQYLQLLRAGGSDAPDKLARIVDNVRHALSIELLCAAQGVDLRAPHRPGPALSAAHDALRRERLGGPAPGRRMQLGRRGSG